ncbi:PRC-barrel domain-containing protein, partial [Geodermatophilus sp. CPCC 206100]|uniref:PRC-barrel domain-containing protein n=1 Tax=Geodermatophilus sp. CPCC 206100 TaxID=3020054 RepID=UPI003B0002A2
MALPERDQAAEWVGRIVVDRDGEEIGVCTAVLADEASGRPEWLYADLEGASAIVPVVDAAESGDRVQVVVSRAAVVAAPSAGGARQLSVAQEAELYQHYGIPSSRSESETLLPAGEAVAGGSSAPAPTDTEEAAARRPESAEHSPAQGGRRLGAVLGALAGLAALVAVVVGLRRRGARLRLRRPATPVEQARERARAASAAAGEGTRRLAAA